MRETMLLEALLDDRQDFLIHQPSDGILHHALFFRECAANVEQIQGVHVVSPISLDLKITRGRLRLPGVAGENAPWLHAPRSFEFCRRHWSSSMSTAVPESPPIASRNAAVSARGTCNII